jgi:hypothetical protein
MSNFDQELFDKWLDNLASGAYSQVRGKLHTPEGHCCLGIGYETIHGADAWTFNESEQAYTTDYREQGILNHLDTQTLGLGDHITISTWCPAEMKLHQDNPTIAGYLIKLNDKGVSFSDIGKIAYYLVTQAQRKAEQD